MIPDKSPFIHYRYQLRSRYAETDKMGYVYYGRYLEYFEEARTEMIRSAGFSYAEFEEQGYMLPVVKASLTYHRPVHYDELMTIDVLLFEPPKIRLDTYYKVTTPKYDRPVTLGHVQLCFVDSASRRPVSAPEVFQHGLKQLRITEISNED